MSAKKKNHFKNSIYVLAIRHGLMLAIPFLILGAFSLLFSSFPIDGYQQFLMNFHHGALTSVFTTLYDVTLGSIALLLIITISYSFGRLSCDDNIFFYPVTSLVSYTAFCGGIQQESYIFGPEWVFSAMVITILCCSLFKRGMKIGRKLEKLHTAGADYLFNQAIQAIFPVIITALMFAIAGGALRAVLGDINITNFGSYLFLKIFSKVGKGLFGALLYVFFVHFLWFFGIHGTNTLEMIAQQVLEPAIGINQNLIGNGFMPTEIFSKTFLDTFAFIGGCGATLCFIIAIFISARKSHNRKLAKVAGISVLFNINEIVIFGFPIIFNPMMLIPFVLTPIVLTLISAFVTSIGMVPMVSETVQWTVPIFLSGYTATGSISGSILQLFNLLLGILIYMPFVKICEDRQSKDFTSSIHHMAKDMAKGEAIGMIPLFLSDGYEYHFDARTLVSDLRNAMKRHQLELFYQVQMDQKGELYGAEALLRWNHPVADYVSPPLMIALAHEDGFLNELGYYIIEKACKDIKTFEANHMKLQISINISAKQLEDEHFVDNVLKLLEKYQITKQFVTFEVTEQSLLNTSDLIIDRIQTLRSKGIEMSMDDFGMGHSSMMYLQENAFDEVKLDGSLVRHISDNERSKKIIMGVIEMARKLNYHVVAEFVETKEQLNILKELGCDIYQGYYYGKAMKVQDFMNEYQRVEN